MRTMFLLAALSVLRVPATFAQDGAPACDGDYAIVRVSAIKPGGMPGFLAAVAAQKAWYRSHGFEDDVIVASRVIVTEPHTGMKYSDSEVVTYHVRPPDADQVEAKKDAAWNAFVKQYQNTSVIKSEYLTCMPKLVP